MRVVTRALSIASMVSGRPGPVPAGGENCARTCAAPAPTITQNEDRRPTCESLDRFALHRTASAPVARKGHSRRKRDRTKNTARPKIITNSPHQTALPVRRKSQIQPAMVSSAGNGYSHILNGRRSGGPTPPQQHHAYGLSNELNDQPHGQHRRNHRPQLEEQRKNEGQCPKKQAARRAETSSSDVRAQTR